MRHHLGEYDRDRRLPHRRPNPVRFVATIRVSKGSPLREKKPRQKSKGSEDSSGENSSESEGVKVTKANKKPKKYVSL